MVKLKIACRLEAVVVDFVHGGKSLKDGGFLGSTDTAQLAMTKKLRHGNNYVYTANMKKGCNQGFGPIWACKLLHK